MFHWAAFPEGLEFRDSITGETIVDQKIDKRFHDKYRAPYGVIHRADMLNVFLGACKVRTWSSSPRRRRSLRSTMMAAASR